MTGWTAKAMIEGEDGPRRRRDQLTVMRGDENRSAVGVDFVEQGHDLFGQDIIQIACRLIGQDQGRFVDQRTCQRNSLLLPT